MKCDGHCISQGQTVDSLQIAHLIAAGGIYLYQVAASGGGEKLVFMECAAKASSWLMLGVCSNKFLRRQQISQETEKTG